MTKTLTRTIALLGALSSFSLVAFEAQAVTLRVKCGTGANSSHGSVDGKFLSPGNYYSMFKSGDNSATSPLGRTRGDEAEVEFDFDSHRDDIRRGATPIARDFIVNGQATGELYDEAGGLVATKTVNCRRR